MFQMLFLYILKHLRLTGSFIIIFIILLLILIFLHVEYKTQLVLVVVDFPHK